ncbi:MAG TPA: hypothetical protein VL463_32855 [Kofleriaceae bacterium]|nr:hypothetical protein [Kofleriaceae bacterium]
MRRAIGIIFVAACGGGSTRSGTDFVGTYAVTAHHMNMMQGTTVACSDSGPSVTNGPMYFALIVDPFFDDPSFIKMQTCTAPGTCTDTLDTFNPGGPGLEELSANTQTGGGTNCNLYAGHGTVTLTGDVAHVEVRSWFESPNLQSSDCTLDKAEALRSSPDCETVEVWDGTRMP